MSRHPGATVIMLDVTSSMSRGEIALVVFVFALVWSAGALPRLGDRLGAFWDGRRRRPRDGD
jgi:Sec-independent protein translocase protein TatA